MIWILLATLGVPLWLLVGALIAGWWSRRAFRRVPGVFAAKLFLVSGTTPGVKESPPRLPIYAVWVHDVLLVHQGFALVRSRALPVASLTRPVSSAKELTHLGDEVEIFHLHLDSGATLALGAAASSRNLMVGPFASILL